MHAGAEVINQNHHHVYVGRMKAENYCKLDDWFASVTAFG